ncbi:hypothetical protein [Luteolibacter luteus]|uniref:Uncharacterized protein n=1 Tax=Luteolibacter luteus TaxID=2728835 RepID=A0A858RF16_9BACT|nr:hypothetical protein [Luteolibacter luteus]QJE95138.1 hypothetical protein HHL09_04910 [Luteolibacter luteus]
MNVILNSRTLVGPQHTAAETFLRDRYPMDLAKIDWLQSPSARCVLELQQAAHVAAVSGDPNTAVNPFPESEALVSLEESLRAHIGLDPYVGDDCSQSEGRSSPR